MTEDHTIQGAELFANKNTGLMINCDSLMINTVYILQFQTAAFSSFVFVHDLTP